MRRAGTWRLRACERRDRFAVNFIEAKKIVAEFAGGPDFPLLLGMSGTGEPIEIYLKAAAAQRGLSARVRLLAFNTLHQTLLTEPIPGEREVFLLLPWDLVPELDWRSGLPAGRLDPDAVLSAADAVLRRITQRPTARVLYLAAAIPAAFADRRTQDSVSAMLAAMAAQLGARLLTPEDFSLGSYFTSGLPVAGRALSRIAEVAVELAADPRVEPAKVLVTDLDNTLWRGVIAEDGLDGISWRAEGAGYRHFVYQTFLQRLKGEGILLAAVSRNSPEIALAPLRSGGMPLAEDDFVAIVATYHSKSAQIRELARHLNLGLDAIVFVDDNPVELHEVSQQLPAVQCVAFPSKDDELPALLIDLNARLARPEVTTEDRGRTELYRRRLEGMVPQTAEGADLKEFLRDLRMRLVLHDRSGSDRTRAVQLINKTNQFNLNGRRVTDDEVAATLSAGGRLLTATLEDRTGSHGEILAMLINADRVVTSFVLSCRVFQRRVEAAFCAWLAEQASPPVALSFAPTDRNEPFRLFLRDPTFSPAAAGIVSWDADVYAETHAEDLALFEVATSVQA
jgi:FkbH-like protein